MFDVVVVVVVRRVRCTTTSRAKDGGEIGRQIRLYGSQSYSFLNGVRAVSDLMSERGCPPRIASLARKGSSGLVDRVEDNEGSTGRQCRRSARD